MSLGRSSEKRPYAAGHFELAIDGHKTSAYLRSVDGGHIRAALVDEPIGPECSRIKHMSTCDIDPFTIDMGLSGAGDVLKWIQSSWRKEWSRRNGQITHANFDLYATYEHEFYDALIMETTFPTLDGASREAAYLKVKFQPERVTTVKRDSSQRIQGNMSPKQKMWLPSHFELKIDGVEGCEYVNKIESFTIKQNIKKLYTGDPRDRFPRIEPISVQFPSLQCTIASGYATHIQEWARQYIEKGQSEKKAQKTGSLKFRSPSGETIFRLNLYEVGIQSAQIMASQANADQIKRVKFELFVGRMDLDGAASLGLA